MPSPVPAEEKHRPWLLVIGAGGHAAVVIEVARAAGLEPVVALDPGKQNHVLGVPVRGSDDRIEEILSEGQIEIGTVAIGSNSLRRKLGLRLRTLSCPMPPIIHPSAVVSPTATIGDGTVIMAGAIINARAVIGEDCIINTAAIIEHDCVLGDGVHAAPRSVMGGTCKLGDGTLFGIGASARPGTLIGAHVTVGAGSTVVSAIPDGMTVIGNPARPKARTREPAPPG